MTIEQIAIVGGGPGGLMLARLLQLRGLRPVVFERDADSGKRPQGGSLDLHGETGQMAMRLADLEDEFMRAARPEDQGDRLFDPDGRLLFEVDGSDGNRPEIDRSSLRQILLDSLSHSTIRWDSRVTDLVEIAGGFTLSVNGNWENFDLVVGADRAWSRIRPLLTEATPNYEGVTLVELGFDAVRHPEIAALTGNGKMFAVGDNRALITQKNGHGHIRGYAGVRMPEAQSRDWATSSPETLREKMLNAFAGWAPGLATIVGTGDLIGVRPMYALPPGHRWKSRSSVTMLGDAAHLMSPFSGEGVNLALADAVTLAEAIGAGGGSSQMSDAETLICDRAAPAAEGAAQGLAGVFSDEGAARALDHYRERIT